MLCDLDFKEKLQNWRRNKNLYRAAVFQTTKQSLVDRYLVLSIIFSFVIVTFCVVDDKSILKVSDSIFFTKNLFKNVGQTSRQRSLERHQLSRGCRKCLWTSGRFGRKVQLLCSMKSLIKYLHCQGSKLWDG